jgi:VirE N-terminal domain
MSWLQQQVSLYATHADNIGRSASIRDVLLSHFARDLDTIIDLNRLDREAPDYKRRKLELKSTLQCFTPAGFLKTKEAGKMTEFSRTGLLQLDFDYQDIFEYDIEELKRAVFSLPFMAFCGLSCSGDGFYALALIAEPYRLAEYAEHIFQVLIDYGIHADQSKGKKVENLRYVSYDSKMLIRDEPEPLLVKNFRTKPIEKRAVPSNYRSKSMNSSNALINSLFQRIKAVKTGSRWETVQRVAYSLGGIGDPSLIDLLKSEIEANPEFNGEEEKYCRCADVCFEAGSLRPLNPVHA